MFQRTRMFTSTWVATRLQRFVVDVSGAVRCCSANQMPRQRSPTKPDEASGTLLSAYGRSKLGRRDRPRPVHGEPTSASPGFLSGPSGKGKPGVFASGDRAVPPALSCVGHRQRKPWPCSTKMRERIPIEAENHAGAGSAEIGGRVKRTGT